MKEGLALSNAAETVINRLGENGYEGYAVGGCVRDSLLGLVPNDFDVTTNALPNEVLSLFKKDFTVVETGLKHGTVTVVIDGEPIEVTTFRCDGDYLDGRHPEKVCFTRSLSEDLCRRDFTVNAMAYSESRGLIDLFDGKKDLEKGIIRTVGNPEDRFNEDALRILRALRFASTYDFLIEEKTKNAIFKQKESLTLLSAERIFSELKRLVTGKGAERILLEYSSVLAVILPEIKESIGFSQCTPYHLYDVYTHSVKTLAACPPDTVLRLSALLHDCGKPETFKETDGVGHFFGHASVSAEKTRAAMNRLKSDNATKDAVVTLVKYHDTDVQENEKNIKKWLGRLTPELFGRLIDLKIADNSAKTKESLERLKKYENIKKMAKDILEKEECFSLRQLKVNGSDLISIGFPKGREIGEMLNTLLEMVISGECENERETLLNEARRKISAKKTVMT